MMKQALACAALFLSLSTRALDFKAPVTQAPESLEMPVLPAAAVQASMPAMSASAVMIPAAAITIAPAPQAVVEALASDPSFKIVADAQKTDDVGARQAALGSIFDHSAGRNGVASAVAAPKASARLISGLKRFVPKAAAAVVALHAASAPLMASTSQGMSHEMGTKLFIAGLALFFGTISFFAFVLPQWQLKKAAAAYRQALAEKGVKGVASVEYDFLPPSAEFNSSGRQALIVNFDKAGDYRRAVRLKLLPDSGYYPVTAQLDEWARKSRVRARYEKKLRAIEGVVYVWDYGAEGFQVLFADQLFLNKARSQGLLPKKMWGLERGWIVPRAQRTVRVGPSDYSAYPSMPPY